MVNKSLKSMTAFGRSSIQTPLGCFQVEIQTVNRRHLEMNLYLPRQLSRFEMDIRKWVEEKIARGQVTLSVQWKREESVEIAVTPNLPLVKALKSAWEKIGQEIGSTEKVSFDVLAEQKDILVFEEEIENESLYRETLAKSISEALDRAVEMKEKEGERICQDFLQRLTSIQKQMDLISQNAEKATEKYREKLLKKLEELFKGHPENEEKVVREVAVFAEKIDVSEEIFRFNNHLENFQQFLKTALQPGETRGKKLEFWLQELNREVNTIGAKSADLHITHAVIFIKSELEKIREQMQNIE